MKKMIFTLAMVFGLTSVVNAQQAGKVWVGGSVGFETSKITDGNRTTSYNILPEVGYNMTDNFGLAIRLGYAHDEINVGAQKQKLDGFVVNPFARYSFLKGNLGGLFVDGGVGYTYGKNKTTSVKSHELEVGFRPGVALNVSDKVALTGRFGFLGYQYEKLGSQKTNTFGFDFDMRQVQLGVNILF